MSDDEGLVSTVRETFGSARMGNRRHRVGGDLSETSAKALCGERLRRFDDVAQMTPCARCEASFAARHHQVAPPAGSEAPAPTTTPDSPGSGLGSGHNIEEPQP